MTKQLPENFPRFDSQSRKQMKDVELVASLLLLIEEGVSGYSQDDLDKAFSDRDATWEDAAETEQRFQRTIEFIAPLISLPPEDPLSRSRLRNQADFYSLFGSIAECMKAADPILQEPKALLAQRLEAFLQIVEDDQRRAQHESAARYLNAARSNSNDIGQRRSRIDIITAALKG